jgi:hypothetical protein
LQIAILPLILENSDFDNFLSLTTSLDKNSSTAFTQELFMKESEKFVETLMSVHAFYEIEKIIDLGRRTQNSVQIVYWIYANMISME